MFYFLPIHNLNWFGGSGDGNKTFYEDFGKNNWDRIAFMSLASLNLSLISSVCYLIYNKSVFGEGGEGT